MLTTQIHTPINFQQVFQPFDAKILVALDFCIKVLQNKAPWKKYTFFTRYLCHFVWVTKEISRCYLGKDKTQMSKNPEFVFSFRILKKNTFQAKTKRRWLYFIHLCFVLTFQVLYIQHVDL